MALKWRLNPDTGEAEIYDDESGVVLNAVGRQQPQQTTGASDTAGLSDAELQWRTAYLREHGWVPPRNWDEQRQLRDAAAIWAAQHGSPMSWGNQYGDNRVPLDVWKRLGTASGTGDVGPMGPAAWAQAADDLGGAYLAARGERYHPADTALTTSTKQGLLTAILSALRR